MRYIFPLLTVFFISVQSVCAQSFEAEVSAGLTASQVSGDNLAGFNKAGFVGGAGVGFPVGERWMLKSEVFFVQKGSRATEKDPIFFKWSIAYLEIPLLMSFRLNERFFIDGGLAADLLVSSRVDYGAGWQKTNSAMYALNPVWILGLGYKLSDKIAFKARHSYSLTRTNPAQNHYNNTVAVYLSLMLK